MHSLYFFLGPKVESNAFDLHDPSELFEQGCAVEAQEDSVSEVGPLFALFPALEAISIGLIFKEMNERRRWQVLYFLHLYYIKPSANTISKTIMLINEACNIFHEWTR